MKCMREEAIEVNDILATDHSPENMFLECALEIARSIDSLEGRAEIISLVAFNYAEAGQIDLAVDLAETINDSYLRDQALAGIAAKCIEAGTPDYADTLADRIEDDTAYALAMEQVAVAYAEQGAFEKSIEVAHKSEESAPTLNRVALSCLARGQLVEALQATRSIDYLDLKAPLLVELATRALQDGRNADALELLLEATTAAEDIEFSDQRISTLTTIASLNKRCGQEDEALEILSSAHEQCKKSSDFDPDAALAQIAEGFAELQRYDRADEVIEEIQNPFQFAHANARVGLEYHKAGNAAKALELFNDALETGRDEEVYGDQSLMLRESLLAELADAYASVGHYDEAVQITGWMTSPDRQNRTLGEIARQCVRSGHNSRVFQVTELIQDPYARILWELEIVDAFIAAEQLELADHALSQVVARTATMERPYQKAMALMEIASRFARREQAEQATQLLFEALTTLALIDDGYHQSQALINLAGKYQTLGQRAGKREQTVLEEITLKLER
jgi:tetratricopeptide (TPR) repeat protein